MDIRPSLWRRSSYGRCRIDFTSFVVLLSTLSTASWSPLNIGPHTQFPYSSVGRTIVLKSSGTVSLSSFSKDLLIKPSILNPLATAWAVCMWNRSSLSTTTPRSFSEAVLCKTIPFILYSWWLFRVPRCITLHLSMLNGSCQAADQLASASISCCSILHSSGLSTVLNTFVSSANIFTTELIESGKSLIYIKNRTGPRTLPWGTPLTTSSHPDLASPTRTLWRRPVRNDLIQLYNRPRIPYEYNLLNRRSCGTESNALAKSKYTTSIGFRLSSISVYLLITVISWDTQERPATNPCWCLLRACFSKWLIKVSRTMDSINLQAIEVRLTGL